MSEPEALAALRKMSLSQLIAEVERGDFECAGGPLRLNVPWELIRERIAQLEVNLRTVLKARDDYRDDARARHQEMCGWKGRAEKAEADLTTLQANYDGLVDGGVAAMDRLRADLAAERKRRVGADDALMAATLKAEACERDLTAEREKREQAEQDEKTARMALHILGKETRRYETAAQKRIAALTAALKAASRRTHEHSSEFAHFGLGISNRLPWESCPHPDCLHDKALVKGEAK